MRERRLLVTIGIDLDGDGEYDVEVQVSTIRKWYLKVGIVGLSACSILSYLTGMLD